MTNEDLSYKVIYNQSQIVSLFVAYVYFQNQCLGESFFSVKIHILYLYQHLDFWAGFKILTIYFLSVSIIILVFNPGHRYRYRYRYRLHDLRLFSECLRMRAKRVVISLIPLPPAIKVYRPCNYLLPQMLPNATFANLYLQPATKIRKKCFLKQFIATLMP